MSNSDIRNRFEQMKDNIDDGWVESDTSVPSTPPNSLADVHGEYMNRSIYMSEKSGDSSDSSDSSEISDLSDSKEIDDNQSQEVQREKGTNEEQEESEFTSDDYDEEEDENRVRLETSEEETEEAGDAEDPPVEYVLAEQEFRKAYENEIPSIILITATLFLMLLLIRSICQLCLTMLDSGYCICKRS